MQLTDLSPPTSPSIAQQRSALRRGLGRTRVWAEAGRLSLEPLIDACLADLRFYPQAEEPRDAWLWALITAAGAKDALRAPLLEALQVPGNDGNAQQTAALARRFAEAGDEVFRARLSGARRVEDETLERQMVAGPSYRERLRAISVPQVVAAAQSKDRRVPLPGWGRYADDAALLALVEIIERTESPRAVAQLLRAFSLRALPRIHPRILELARHPDDEVRRPVRFALANNRDPRIRAIATELLPDDASDSVIILFQNSFEPGDEERILTALTLADDDHDRHDVLECVVDVLENNPQADCRALGTVVYASTPWERSRYRAFRLLCDDGDAPEWMVEESRFDSNPETRRLAEAEIGPAHP